jgi:cardiolipin synthase
MPILAYFVINRMDFAALALLAFCALSDFLDGVIARKFNQVSDFGKILDPVADRLLIFTAMVSLSVAGTIPFVILILVLVREAVLFVQVIILAKRGIGPIPVNFLGKAGTAMLLFAFPLFVLVDFSFMNPTLHEILSAFSWSVMLWGIALYYLAGFGYIVTAKEVLSHDGTEENCN